MRLMPLFLVAVASVTVAAQAEGTVTVRQSNGQTNVYDRVAIKIIHSALYVTSRDGKGTLVINKAACSYQGDVMVCFVTSATLVQSGETGPLDLKRGTVYLNLTGDEQSLPMTSMKLPARGIWLSLTTDRGTYIGMTGRLDKVVN